MVILITLIHIAVCFLIIVVLLQSGQSGGVYSGLRRHGQSDRIRPARRGYDFVESHHMVGHHLYGDLDHALGLRLAPCGYELEYADQGCAGQVTTGETCVAPATPPAQFHRNKLQLSALSHHLSEEKLTIDGLES